jgi:hypothetical protein
LNAHQKWKRKKERNRRNHIEGKFGQGKNAYGLADIRAKRRDASESWIGAVFFRMNLVSWAKIADLYAIFCSLFKGWPRPGPFFGPVGNRDRNIRAIGAAQIVPS